MASQPSEAVHTRADTGIPGSIRDIHQFILARNQEQSEAFCNASAKLSRQQYRVLHTTEVVALKCMDGRLNLSVMTKTPVGILNPYRNIGGRFDMGWPFLAELLKEWVWYARDAGKNCILVATYHFSKEEKHRGCKGFGYDTAAARASSAALVQQMGEVWTRPYSMVHPILVGIETDEDALVFHSEEGKSFSVADHVDMDEAELGQVLADLYPEMRRSMRDDLLQLLIGNQCHIKEIRAEKRMPIDMDHREQIIAVGRGFDWLHLPNKALIIGPYSPAWPEAVKTAGGIVLDNFSRTQLDADAGVLLMACALTVHEKGSFEWNLAVQKARSITKLSLEALTQAVPELVGRENFSVLTGVVDANTRLLHLV